MSYRAFLAAMRIRRNNEVRRFFEKSLRVTDDQTHARLNTLSSPRLLHPK